MKSFRFLALKGAVMASAVLWAASVQAADPQVEALLAKMRAAYSATKSIAYSVESHFGAKVYKEEYSFKSPMTVRVRITSPTEKSLQGAITVSTDGSMITVDMDTAAGARQIKEKYSPDVFEKQLLGNLESLCFFDWERQLSTAKGKNMEHSTFKITYGQIWSGRKWTVLEETAAENKVVCQYYIDPKTFFIWRTVVKAMPGGNAEENTDTWITRLGGSSTIEDPKAKFIHI